MTDDELLQYARQILLNDVDLEGQERLKRSHVMVLGIGGLGSPVALYLGAAGIGKLTLVDGDQVDVTNLHRQIIHCRASLNDYKVYSAKDRILGLNPHIDIKAVPEYANETNVSSLVPDVDCIADCTDRFATRFMINRLSLTFKNCRFQDFQTEFQKLRNGNA